MGWTIDHGIHVNTGAKVDISTSFRRRIEDGNAFDLELYDHARSVATR